MDTNPVDVLIRNQKGDQPVTPAVLQLLTDEVSVLRQQRDRFHDRAATTKASEESTSLTLSQMEQSVTLLTDQTQWTEQMTLLRQKVDEGKKKQSAQISASIRSDCNEVSQSMNQESADLQDMILRILQLDDEDMNDDEDDDDDQDDDDVTDATDFN